MAILRPIMSRLATSLTMRPLSANISQGYPLCARRPLDIDDDQLETVSLKQPGRSQHSRGDAGDSDVYGDMGGQDQGSNSRDSLHSQPKTDGPSERSINQVTLLGRVGSDPQIRGTEAKPVTSFSLATNAVWKTQNPGPGDSVWSHRVDWHNVVVFKPGMRESTYNNIHKVNR